MKYLDKGLILFGSFITTAFGVWHFFVPKHWDWYSHISSEATELIIAVRAINVFFSLCLVLFGLMNTLLILNPKTGKFPLIVLLSATCILWAVRIILQLVYPQGSANPYLQYGILSSFVVTFLCYAFGLGIILLGKGTIPVNK